MSHLFRHALAFTGTTLLCLGGLMSCAVDQRGDQAVPGEHPETISTTSQQLGECSPDGTVDDTLGLWSCCSGFAVNGSTVCSNPSDYGTTWASCRHVCGTAPVNGCIPSGGWDDTLSTTACCSGQAVSGSTWCLDPRDFGTTWKSCVQRCQ